jgi:hypothetical protein
MVLAFRSMSSVGSPGLSGEVHVTFEEGTWAAWLYDLLKPYVTKIVVCNPRKNALLKQVSKSDRSMPGS